MTEQEFNILTHKLHSGELERELGRDSYSFWETLNRIMEYTANNETNNHSVVINDMYKYLCHDAP